ncbi:MAG TPA: M23 family metallopeptidase [Alphaproteobacteria bacterium]|nr:M23 family metallopeptidase [Alphaproteobacteria bacterium]
MANTYYQLPGSSYGAPLGPSLSPDTVLRPYAAGQYFYPLPAYVHPNDRPTSGFHAHRDPSYSGGKAHAHAGHDIDAPIGTPAYAVASGTIVRAGRMNGYGLVVDLASDDGIHTFRYAHLDSELVTEGQRVQGGQQIASTGASGVTSSHPHLHFEVHQSGVPTDPMAFFNQHFSNVMGSGPVMALNAPAGQPQANAAAAPARAAYPVAAVPAAYSAPVAPVRASYPSFFTPAQAAYPLAPAAPVVAVPAVFYPLQNNAIFQRAAAYSTAPMAYNAPQASYGAYYPSYAAPARLPAAPAASAHLNTRDLNLQELTRHQTPIWTPAATQMAQAPSPFDYPGTSSG